MIRRIAAVMALLVFAICLLIGIMEADNTFATTVERALTAMVATMVIGLIVGAMARGMLNENLKAHEEKLKKNAASGPPSDR